MIERWEESTRRLQAEYDEHVSDGLKMGILLEMVPPNITEALMASLPDNNAKDENAKEIAKYPITKEILVQYIEAKTDPGGPTSMDCGHLDFHDGRDGDGSSESNNGEVNWKRCPSELRAMGHGRRSSLGWPLGALTLFNLNEDFPKWRQVL